MRQSTYTIFAVARMPNTRTASVGCEICLSCDMLQETRGPVVQAHTAEKRLWNGSCDAKRSSKRRTFRNETSGFDSLPALMSSSAVSVSQNISHLQHLTINNAHDNESSAESQDAFRDDRTNQRTPTIKRAVHFPTASNCAKRKTQESAEARVSSLDSHGEVHPLAPVPSEIDSIAVASSAMRCSTSRSVLASGAVCTR